jgi:hypothetical protein
MPISPGIGVSPIFGGAKPSSAATIESILGAYGLQGHWDAAQEITPEGGPVAGWGDVNSLDAARTWNQATGANQPVIVTSATPAGTPAVHFVDSTDTMATTGGFTTFWAAAAKTSWIVFRPQTGVGAGFNGVMGDSSARHSVSYQGSTQQVRINNNDGVADVIVSAMSNSAFHVYEFRHDGTNLYSRVDSGAEGSIASGTTTGMGASMQIKYGSDISGTQIAEIIFCNQDVPADVRTTVRAFLAAKHGL